MDKQILEVTYMYDFETYKKFYFYTIGFRLPIIIGFPIMLALILAAGIVLSSSAIIILALISAGLFTFIFFTPSIAYKKAKDVYQGNHRIVFYENNMYTETNSAMANQNGTHSYDLLKKVCETDNAFYMYLKSGPCYVIAKKYLNEQQVMTLHNFLLYRFGKLAK